MPDSPNPRSVSHRTRPPTTFPASIGRLNRLSLIAIQHAAFEACFQFGGGNFGIKTVINAGIGAAVALSGKQIIKKIAAGALTGGMVGILLTAIDLGLEFVSWWVHTTRMAEAAAAAKALCVSVTSRVTNQLEPRTRPR